MSIVTWSHGHISKSNLIKPQIIHVIYAEIAIVEIRSMNLSGFLSKMEGSHFDFWTDVKYNRHGGWFCAGECPISKKWLTDDATKIDLFRWLFSNF